MKSIGLITDIAFWEMGNGQNTRIQALHAFLAKNSDLTLYYLGEEAIGLDGIKLEGSNQKTELASLLKEANHDLLIVEKLHLDWVADCANGPIYLDAHDLISDRIKAFQAFHRFCEGPDFHEEIARFQKFDKVIFLQKEELEKVELLLGKEKLLLCPHPVVADTDPQIRKTVETISFFGGPSWPNIDGIQWLHDRVLPLLGNLGEKCIVHGAALYSPFKAFTPQLRTGHLFSSLEAYYRNVDIALNPVLYGSGLKIKTVEAMGYGIPLVTTSSGAEGLPDECKSSLFLADTPEEFANAISTLAHSFSLRNQLSKESQSLARKLFTPEKCFAALLI